jgi:hypothetical protein
MTSIKRVAPIAALISALALGGCAYDGYGGVNVGYGPGYYDDYSGPYGYAPYGWYDGYYYPGSGYWLYDRGGTRHRWSDHQRRYWEQRRDHAGQWNGQTTRPWRPEMRDQRRWNGRDRQSDGTRTWRGRGENANPPVQPQSQPSIQESRPVSPMIKERSDGRHRRGN